jgi:enamine deaminase RidA (YjgF/YER057c/UK114 family)
MVNSAPDFTQQPQVINGFSELMTTAFGDAGLAARSAVGVASHPAGYAVEIEATIEIAR